MRGESATVVPSRIVQSSTRLLLATTLLLATSAWFHAQSAVPTPQSVIGWEPCADYKLATYEQIEKYFRALAAAAPARLKLVEMGRTTEGRNQVMAIVSSEANLSDLERYKSAARRLALRGDGDPITEGDARALAQAGKAVVWIDFGLHSNEVAPGQLAPLLAFRAVTDESEEMRAIRDNVIFLLVPNMNPDGTTMVANWYREHLGKPWESRPPELWHRYAGHDDNRDWFMMNLAETRNSARQLYGEWFPQIVYNQHQAGPFPSRIFVPPFDDPMNPNIPPLVIRGVNLVGEAMTRRLDREGKRGAISRVGFDTWWNGGMRTAPYFHNMIGILTETSHASATPATYDPSTFPREFVNGVPTLEPTTYYPTPYRGGEWHLRDSCDYMMTTSMAVLDIAAKHRVEWLYDTFQMAREAVRANAKETFIVSANQWDWPTAVKMIDVLRLGGVDVEQATASFNAGGKTYPARSFVIRGAQPFSPYARDLLTPQRYPDMRVSPGGPPKRPYDITGWTLNYQMGVTVDRVEEAVMATTTKVDVAAQRPTVTAAPKPSGHAWVLDPRSNDAFIVVNRLLKAGDVVRRFASPLSFRGIRWPAGAFTVVPEEGTDARIRQWATSLGVSVESMANADLPPNQQRAIAGSDLKAPRIGLYHGWGGNMDEGWTRFVLEQFEFPYASVFDRDIRAGDLRARFDVLLLPDATYDSMLNGEAPGTLPDAYTGGMTVRGIANLREFVSAGGTLIAMDRAAELPIAAFGLPVRDVAASASRAADFYVPGSILRLRVDPSHPIGYGMPAEAAAFFMHSPAFEVVGNAPGVHVVAQYPSRDVLMSGWMLGERSIADRAAVVEVSIDTGRVILLGFRTQHRGQSHGTYKLLFNSILRSVN